MIQKEFSFTVRDVNVDALAFLFNVDPIYFTDRELWQRLTCEGALA